MVTNNYIYDELNKSELGLICIKEDKYIQLLTKNTSFSDGIAIWAHNNKDLKIVHIARVFYNEEPGYILKGVSYDTRFYKSHVKRVSSR